MYRRDSPAISLNICIIMFAPIGQDTTRQRLCSLNGLITRLAVSKHAGQLDDLSDPTPIAFALDFDSEY
jgi:hypothetical protein